MTKYLVGAIVVLLCALLSAIRSCTSYKDNCSRLESNQEELLSSTESLKFSKDSLQCEVKSLKLTSEEFLKSNLKLKEEFDILSLKYKRLSSASSVSTKTVYTVQIPATEVSLATDSFVYSEPYLDFKLSKDSLGEVHADITSYDTISRFEYRYPRKILWIIPFGTKYVGEVFVSSNPNSKIVGATSVILTDKQGNPK